VSVEVLRTVGALHARCDEVRARGGWVGFVPTMGALHEGHLALARAARARAGADGLVVTSIFVNPTQFAAHEDLSKYPRDLDADVARCATAGVNVVFAPSVDEIYPPGDSTRVRVSGVSEPLEGEFRPTHFEGVATVVARLFNAVGPCSAVFGRKDYQQLRVIIRMTRDLLLPVEIISHSTVREPDGLAMSSRNRYLSPADRARAAKIPAALGLAVRAWESGERATERLRETAENALRPWVDAMDYVSLRDANDLSALPDVLRAEHRAVLAVAVRVGTTRLIDNVVLGVDPPPCG
jgi:pantoate--beta-alanine ligase